MTLVIAFPAILYFMYILYASAIKQYKEDYNYFYRIADSECISEDTKNVVIFIHNQCFSISMWLEILYIGITMPFYSKSKKAKHFKAITNNIGNSREMKILIGATLRCLRINFMLMLPLYIPTIAIIALWFMICNCLAQLFKGFIYEYLMENLCNRYLKINKTSKHQQKELSLAA